jgi:hypothetical protein
MLSLEVRKLNTFGPVSRVLIETLLDSKRRKERITSRLAFANVCQSK